MHLSTVVIENFRGIRRVRLDFDHTTVMVGENSFGKSNLLAALDLALGARTRGAAVALQPSDLHRDPEGHAAEEISIALRFRERNDGEWDTRSLDPVRPAMTQLDGARRRLELTLTGRSNGETLATDVRFLNAERQPLVGVDHAALLVGLRRVSPVILMGAEAFAPNSGDGELDNAALGPHLHPDVRQLRFQIRHLFRRLAGREVPPSPSEIEEGLAAVQRALASRPELMLQQRTPTRHSRHLISTPLRLAMGRPPGAELDHGLAAGTAALGPLILLGALLEAMGPAGLAPGARPIVAIEDAEAHLHPILLASLWGHIEAVKAQRVVTTNSPELLAAVPLTALRRLVRRHDSTEVHRLQRGSLSAEEQRRVGYHVRMRRGGAFFARLWLLIEGETEAWLMPELARLSGHDLPIEGVHTIEFAQCGVAPLVKLANDLGIPWHVLADGDPAGKSYAEAARAHLHGAREQDRITCLPVNSIERCLWDHGYEDVFRRQLSMSVSGAEAELPPDEIIARAGRSRRKPQLALDVLDAAARQGSPGVPWVISELIETIVKAARSAVAWNPERSADA